MPGCWRARPGAAAIISVVTGPGQGIRGLQVISSEDVHRVTGPRIRQARELARRLATGTGSLSRTRGPASAMTTAMAMAMARPAAVRSFGNPG
jgi:hypothetical protein